MMRDITNIEKGAPSGAPSRRGHTAVGCVSPREVPFEEKIENEIPWEQIKARFESSDISVSTLANEFSISESMLQYYIEIEGWQSNTNKDVLELLKNNDPTAVDRVKEALKDKYVLKELLQDTKLQPKYHIVEIAVLNKAVEILSAINQDMPTAGEQFLKTVKAIKSLYEIAKPVKIGGKEGGAESGSDTKQLTIQILNKA